MDLEQKSALRAFHDDSALKNLLAFRCASARTSGIYRQGGCNGEDLRVQRGCAVSVMLQAERANFKDFEVHFGLSTGFARMAETIFEALPFDFAELFPEYIVAAVPLGADTRPLKWRLMSQTLVEHEAAEHRIVAETVRQTLDFLGPLAAGASPDIIEARERMIAALKTLARAVIAVDAQPHPVREVALLAKSTLEAAAIVCEDEAERTLARALRCVIGRREDAVRAARRMARLLVDQRTEAQKRMDAAFVGSLLGYGAPLLAESDHVP